MFTKFILFPLPETLQEWTEWKNWSNSTTKLDTYVQYNSIQNDFQQLRQNLEQMPAKDESITKQSTNCEIWATLGSTSDQTNETGAET